jgi:hypothetical protein
MRKHILIAAAALLFLYLITPSAYAGDCIEISTPEELAAISDMPSRYYVLTEDIDMSGIEWTPISFYGVLDGKGHTIYNLNVTALGAESATTYDGNHKEYETYFAGLFSVVRDAEITNLNLLNVKVDISTDKNCFAAGLAGFAEDTSISNCSVKGRVKLYQTNTMCGVAGIVGFGHGSIDGCTADTELVFIDGDTEIKCEEFLGGILACGYTDIDKSSVVLKGYASVQGYVHNGGITGMYYVYNRAEKARPGYVHGNTVDAEIYFYEDNTDRRAYCDPYVGERLSSYLTVSDNTTVNYLNGETFDYGTVLLPDMCGEPEYTAVITPPTCTEYGYTTYTCACCSYSYTDDYTHPAHKPGEYVTVKEPSYEETGLKQLNCSACGELLDEEEIPRLIYVSSCELNAAELELTYKSSSALTAEVLPPDAYNKGLIWSSSDESVVTVDESGGLYAAGRGSAIITLTSADGNASSSCKVTVKYTFWQWVIIILLFGWIWY